jgi:uncharacterized membrane protein
VAVVALAFWVACLGLTLLRYHLFENTLDQGTFNQVFWNGLHGRPFQGSLSSTLSYAVTRRGEAPSVSYLRLGQHFTPTQALWLPAYAVWPSAVTLGVLQVTLVTAAGAVLYALARTRLDAPLASLVAIGYYAAHAVIGPALSNFHDLCQLPLLLFGLLLALERRRWAMVWALAVLVLGVREDAGMTLVGVGLFLVASRRHPRLGAALLATSVAYMLVVTAVVMPRLSPDISGRFMVERFGAILGGREASTLELVATLARRPALLLRELVTPVGPTLEHLAGQWLPLAFVPAVSPAAWLLSAPVFAGLFLQSGDFSLQLNARFALTAVPAVFYGAVLWWSRHQAAIERRHVARAWVACMIASAAFAIGSNPHGTVALVTAGAGGSGQMAGRLERARTLRALVARVPSGASVSASARIVPQLSSRRRITRLPVVRLRDDSGEIRPVDYVVADVAGWRPCTVERREPIRWERAEMSRLDALLRDDGYGLLHFSAGAVLLQRGAPDAEDARRDWRDFLARCHRSVSAGEDGRAGPR